MSEQDYVNGSRQAWRSMLAQCLAQLGDSDRDEHGWRLEREDTISALRRVCEDFGDNDWDESDHLADVIEKHLRQHLLEPSESERSVPGEYGETVLASGTTAGDVGKDNAAMIREAADHLLRHIMQYQDQYVQAWIAATGLHPTKCQLVQRHGQDGSITMTVEPLEMHNGLTAQVRLRDEQIARLRAENEELRERVLRAEKQKG